MVALVVSHLILAALLFAVGSHLPRRVVLGSALVAPAIGAGWALAQVPSVLDGAEPSSRHVWIGGLDVAFSFRLDGFALLMALVVTGIGALVLAYSVGYFGPEVPAERLARFAGGFVAFAGSMLGLVLADDVWTLFVFWEATTITSFVLIGLDHDAASARAAARQALLVTGAGGLALLGGLAILSEAAGTTALDGLVQADDARAVVQVGLALLLVGAVTKSAQVPFQFWLPGAMAAPTPVSAYLHSATMVKAGVILVGRMAPVFAEVGWWRPVIVVVGGLTMLAGGIGALRQHDAKLLLANGTVSQLGLLVLLLGIGHPEATAAGVAMLVGHALFKAALFLVVGAVDHATGTRDIRRLSGLGRRLPVLATLAAVATASMVGLPPLLGFVAKEAALEALLDEGGTWSVVALVAVVLGSVLTTAYSARLWFGLFGTRRVEEPAAVAHAPGPALLGPVVVLVVATIAGGLAAGPLGDALGTASEALDHDAHGHLVLWAGIKPALVISVVIVALGAALHLALGRTAVGVPAPRLSGERAFLRTYDGVQDGARRLTGLVQNGSLPAYIAVVFVMVVAGLGAAAVSGLDVGAAGTVDGGLLQAAVAVLAAGMAIAIVVTRRRFVAVLMLGTVGYSVAVIFLLYGAPDLALTQVLVETVTLVVFLLVLRHLPEGYAPPPEWAPRVLRVAVALAVGVAVAGFALAAGTARTERPVADRMIEESEPVGGGRNVVNVILIDIRGIDTMGEITVLAIAAAGVANLVRAARRHDRDRGDPLGHPDEVTPAPDDGGVVDDAMAIGPRSVVFDQVTRAAFPIILLVSVYVALRGHNAPGGGFAGGLIAGIAFVMRFLAGGSPRLARVRALPASGLIGVGLLMGVATGLASTLAGDQFLESDIAKLHLPLIGEVKLVSTTVYDLGVYLLVLGVVLSVLTHLGAEATTRPRTTIQLDGEAP